MGCSEPGMKIMMGASLPQKDVVSIAGTHANKLQAIVSLQLVASLECVASGMSCGQKFKPNW